MTSLPTALQQQELVRQYRAAEDFGVSFSACPFSQRCMCRFENTCILGQGDVWVDPGMLTGDVLHCCVC